MSALALATPSDASRRGGQDHHGDQDRHGQKVEILDDCNPASFNAAFGDVCTGDGETTVEQFLAELTATQQAKEWKFDPSMLTVRAGRPVILENEGGETHTFTMVGSFGGGFVAPLNAISGNPVPAGECAATINGELVPRPPSAVNVFVDADKEAAFSTAGLTPGTYKFECCIHPWMRVVLTVK
ncbi:MAG: hypothetical protein ABIP19_05035 [Dermatophilaceae bacterium]